MEEIIGEQASPPAAAATAVVVSKLEGLELGEDASSSSTSPKKPNLEVIGEASSTSSSTKVNLDQVDDPGSKPQRNLDNIDDVVILLKAAESSYGLAMTYSGADRTVNMTSALVFAKAAVALIEEKVEEFSGEIVEASGEMPDSLPTSVGAAELTQERKALEIQIRDILSSGDLQRALYQAYNAIQEYPQEPMFHLLAADIHFQLATTTSGDEHTNHLVKCHNSAREAASGISDLGLLHEIATKLLSIVLIEPQPHVTRLACTGASWVCVKAGVEMSKMGIGKDATNPTFQDIRSHCRDRLRSMDKNAEVIHETNVNLEEMVEEMNAEVIRETNVNLEEMVEEMDESYRPSTSEINPIREPWRRKK